MQSVRHVTARTHSMRSNQSLYAENTMTQAIYPACYVAGVDVAYRRCLCSHYHTNY